MWTHQTHWWLCSDRDKKNNGGKQIFTGGYTANMGGGLEINSGNSKSVLLENGSSRHGKTRNIELHSNSG